MQVVSVFFTGDELESESKVMPLTLLGMPLGYSLFLDCIRSEGISRIRNKQADAVPKDHCEIQTWMTDVTRVSEHCAFARQTCFCSVLLKGFFSHNSFHAYNRHISSQVNSLFERLIVWCLHYLAVCFLCEVVCFARNKAWLALCHLRLSFLNFIPIGIVTLGCNLLLTRSFCKFCRFLHS